MTDTQTEHEPDFFDRLARWVIGFLLLFGLAYFVRGEFTGPVIEFGPASMIQVSDAAVGDWVSVTFPIVKRRDCEIQMDAPGPLVIQRGRFVRVEAWDRDGPFLRPSPAWQPGRIKFLVPEGLEPGPAGFQFAATFRCMLGRKIERSPAVEFEVLATE